MPVVGCGKRRLTCGIARDVVYVLARMVTAVGPGGPALDLQAIRPNPVVKAGGRVVCEIDGEPLFAGADAATAAVDELIRTEVLVEDRCCRRPQGRAWSVSSRLRRLRVC